jgi:protease-4
MRAMMAAILAGAVALAGCGGRTIRLDLVPVGEGLEEKTVETADAHLFTTDKIAMITVSGLIANMKTSGILSSSPNKVSDFREALDACAKDPAIKAVVLRINSPGGTVTASHMTYQDVLNFKKKTGKPVVTCMMDVCASGGYYLSCASDYRVAYPTTITGSIGVIIETVNINGTLKKIGVATEAVKSGPNKDMVSPFKPPPKDMDAPLSDADRALLQDVVNEFYAGFKAVVKAAPNKVADADWDRLTDGRVVTGKEAARVGLIDQVGDLDTAINKAKQLAHIDHAKIVVFTRRDDTHGSIYAANPGTGNTQPQVNLLNLNLDLGDLIPHGQSEFLDLWTGFTSE